MTGPMDENSDPYKREDHRQIQEKPKQDKMGKLKREVEFLEKGMQRVRAKLQKPMARPYTNTLYQNGRTKTKTMSR